MKDANRPLRKAVWWSVGSRVSLALVLALCASAGIRVAPQVRLALELTTAIPLLILATRLTMAYRRHRRDGMRRLSALHAVYADAIPLPVHEARLFTSTLRWLAFRRHGVRAGDMAVPYASGGAALLFAFAYASAIETVVLAFIIPWPVVREIALALDIWGCTSSSPSTPPSSSARMSSTRTARCGCAELSQGGQTTVTVQLTRPVTFTRPLGKTACACAFHFYAADPAAAVAAIRGRVLALQATPSR